MKEIKEMLITPEKYSCDVCVCGGGVAGIAAALSAKRTKSEREFCAACRGRGKEKRPPTEAFFAYSACTGSCAVSSAGWACRSELIWLMQLLTSTSTTTHAAMVRAMGTR